MPQATLSAARLFDGAVPPTADGLKELLFGTKAELADWTDDQLRIEATADRLDLLTEGGLRAALAPLLPGLPPPVRRGPPGPDHGVRIDVDPSVAPLRPAIGAVLVTAPAGRPLDAGLLDEAVRFQELLHATVGGGRRLASLGLYPIDRATPPLRYALAPVGSIAFEPLDGGGTVDAATFYARHPLAQAYGAWGRAGDACLVLADSAGGVLSLPPVLNARPLGAAAPGDARLLLESTGLLEARVVDALGLLSLVFVARGWGIRPVPVVRGDRTDPGTAATEPRALPLTEPAIRAVLGGAIPAPEVEALLGRAGLSARPHPGGGWSVSVPPWRPDLLAEVDLVEEILVARGITADEGLLLPSPTRGARRPETRFRRRVGTLLLGLGYVPIATPTLVDAALVGLLGRDRALEVANPVSEKFAYLKDAVQVSLVGALGRNTRHGYPQRLQEVGPVIVADPSAEAGGTTRYHAGVVLASDRAGFADGAAVVDYVLRALGTAGVREPATIPGTIPGRAARVRLAGETVAEVGELHPRVLADRSVPVPVAWAEIDLTSLWPLVARERTP